MIGHRFERLGCFLRWFFNASPDWSDSRNHVIEAETMQSRHNEPDEFIQKLSRDTTEPVDRSEARCENR